LRKIIHIDMDAFFASVEQRDAPELRGLPVAVGYAGKRGVVAAASYEARKFGVRSAMPSVTALRLCPQLIFVRGNFDRYKEVSGQIRDIFLEYTDLVEPLSLDEAYLDVTENKMGIASAMRVAMEIRQKIFEQTQLTASAGVSFNKFLAKVASGINKPNGMKTILPDQANAFLEQLPIERFHGIGKVTAEKMRKMGITNGAELKLRDETELYRLFGKAGRHYYRIVRADDDRAVNPTRIRKSIGAERTFSDDLEQLNDIKARLLPLVAEVFGYMEKKNLFGKTVTLKAKLANFQTKTRSKTFPQELRTLDILQTACFDLADAHLTDFGAIRLIGLSVSNFANEMPDLPNVGVQLEFPFI
jgi:DNA polymerase IV